MPTGYGHTSSIGQISGVGTSDFAAAGLGSPGSALAEALANYTPTTEEPAVYAGFGLYRKEGEMQSPVQHPEILRGI